MRRLISYSGGLGSFMAAWLTIQEHGAKNCELVFTDTKTEDPDLYRFIKETAKVLETKLTILKDGRNIWEVFQDVKFMGNSRVDPCSRILKRELFRRWVEKNYSWENGDGTTSRNAVIVFGIGKEEAHRMKAIKERWSPWLTEAPLISEPHTREQIEDLLAELGVEPPSLYEHGFLHNNCGGFCVKTGQKQMKLLLEKFPERYAWHETQQEKLFKIIGKRHGFIRRAVDGKIYYLGLKEFRELVEAGERVDMYNEAGCGCFI